MARLSGCFWGSVACLEVSYPAQSNGYSMLPNKTCDIVAPLPSYTLVRSSAPSGSKELTGRRIKKFHQVKPVAWAEVLGE